MERALPPGWTSHVSSRTGAQYWFHAATKTTVWEPPSATTATTTADAPAPAAATPSFDEQMEAERRAAAAGRPDCPRVAAGTPLPDIIRRLRTERATTRPGTGTEFQHIFEIPNDELAAVTVAVQVDQILKTRLKVGWRLRSHALLSPPPPPTHTILTTPPLCPCT